jgi:hypothetical protein
LTGTPSVIIYLTISIEQTNNRAFRFGHITYAVVAFESMTLTFRCFGVTETDRCDVSGIIYRSLDFPKDQKNLPVPMFFRLLGRADSMTARQISLACSSNILDRELNDDSAICGFS